MNLPPISISKKTGQEYLQYNKRSQKNITVFDFWQWAMSDLLNNTTRGILAEYIVAVSLGMHKTVRKAWEAYDLEYNNIRIEVKSAAYIQSWYQKDYSKISFSVRKTKWWDQETNKQSTTSKWQADVYVFCLLDHKNQETIDPLNLNQWRFFILSRNTIQNKVPTTKSFTIKKLKELDATECSYKRLKRYIQEANYNNA